MEFTQIELEILFDLLREGNPLPASYKDRIVFEDDNSDSDDESNSKKPMVLEKLNDLIGSDLKKRGLFDKIRMIACSDIPVLIEGEKGAGKKLMARTIHEIGLGNDNPFIMVDCSSMSDDLSESQLLGHTRGAFTGAITEKKGLIEMADHGTIVFNEVDKLPIRSQVLLLRLLENKSIERLGSNKQLSIETRVIATSHNDLKEAIQKGSFRDDLYFHISSVTLPIPPLRERRDDIPALAKFFLDKYARQSNKRLAGFSAPALGVLWHHNWPGNVTELENRIKGAVVMTTGRKIIPKDLGFDIPKDTMKYAGMTLKDAREKMETEMVLKTLAKHKNNITRTADELGISRPTLYELMEKLKIPKP